MPAEQFTTRCDARPGAPQRAGSEALVPQRAGTVPYIVCGVAQRHAAARAARLRAAGELQPLHREALMTVFSLTTSRSKLVDRSSARRIAALTYFGDESRVDEVRPVRRRVMRDVLAVLHRHGVIEFEGALGGPTAGCVVAVPLTPDVQHELHVLGYEIDVANMQDAVHVSTLNVHRLDANVHRPEPQRAPPAQQHRGETEKSSEGESTDPLALELHHALTGPAPLSESIDAIQSARREGVQDSTTREVIGRGGLKWPSDFNKAALLAHADRLRWPDTQEEWECADGNPECIRPGRIFDEETDTVRLCSCHVASLAS